MYKKSIKAMRRFICPYIHRSILPAEKESLTLLQFPSGNSKEPITVIEVGPTTHACPPGFCKLLFTVNLG